jgi:hypothetical protein
MPGQEYTALIGVVLGWVLGEAGRWIWVRHEKKCGAPDEMRSGEKRSMRLRG